MKFSLPYILLLLGVHTAIAIGATSLDRTYTGHLNLARDDIWKPQPGCRNTPHVFTPISKPFSIGTDKTLGLYQVIEKDTNNVGTSVRAWGSIILRSSTEDMADGSVVLEATSNDEKLQVGFQTDSRGNNQVFQIITPQKPQWWSGLGGEPCLQVQVTISVPQNAHLQEIRLNSKQINMEIRDGLKLNISDGFTITTTSGNIRTSTLVNLGGQTIPYVIESPDMKLKTTSGSITGWFSLYDSFKISTTSGNVFSQILASPNAVNNLKHSILDISTTSGNINVTESITSDPRQRRAVKISSTSGDIEASIAVNSATSFSSTSGDQDLRIFPVYANYASDDHIAPSLNANATSGNIFANILNPLASSSSNSTVTPGSAFSYKTTSGRVTLNYPSSWEGSVEMQSLSGDMNTVGLDTTVKQSTKQIEGRKGKGNSTIRAASTSGDIVLAIGGTGSSKGGKPNKNNARHSFQAWRFMGSAVFHLAPFIVVVTLLI